MRPQCAGLTHFDQLAAERIPSVSDELRAANGRSRPMTVKPAGRMVYAAFGALAGV